MASGGLTDDQVFGPQSAYGAANPAYPAPPVQPVTVQPLPNLPGYVGDPSFVPAPGAGPTEPFGQAPAVRLGGQQGLTDADVFGAGGAPVASKGVSETLGLEKGLSEPFANLWSRVNNSPLLSSVADSVDAAWPEFSAIRDLTGRLSKIGMADVNQKQAQGYVPGKLGVFGGNVADTALMPGGPLVGGALGGALLSNSDDLGGMARDAAIGAVGGKLAHSAIGAIGNMVSPTVAPAVKTLIGEGVPLTPGQIQGGALHRLEDAARSIPIFGDVVGAAQKRGVEGLNVAVANRALAPIGETVPEDVAPGRDAIAYAGDKLSERYNALMPSLTLTADPQLGSDLHGLGTAAAMLPKDHAQMLGRMVAQNIMDKIDPTTGVMDGAALKDAETTLGQRIARYKKSPIPADQDLADGLMQTRQILRDWVARSNPAAAEELNRLNAGWANLAIGEDAASRLAATDGLFTPSQLAGAVRGANDTVRKRGYARGTALMQDLSDAALERLPPTVPDSGSPFRHALEAGVAGLVGKEAGLGGALGRASLVGAVLSAPYTKVGQPVMQNILAGARPSYSPAVAAILKKLQPGVRAIGTTGALGLAGPQPQ